MMKLWFYIKLGKFYYCFSVLKLIRDFKKELNVEFIEKCIGL